MDHQGPDSQPELLLDRWLGETDAERGRQQLEVLFTRHVAPLVRRIVAFKLALPHADVEDVCQNALFHLLARLERLKSGDGSAAFRDFTAYIAVTAYNACNAYFRAKRPAWLSLSMKMRYAATHAPKFALWEGPEGRDVVGFAANRGKAALTGDEVLARACETLKRRLDASRLNITELMEQLLKAAGGPVIFETLVDAAAELAGVQDEGIRSLEQAAPSLQASDPAMDTLLIRRHYIRVVWKEITALPLEHRRALLLNLNDSAGGDIRLFERLGIASVRQIASVVEMDAMEFAGFWKDLPLDDNRLAQILGISRQDVANRRSTARKRLARRLQEAGLGI
jgi:DNA-directed RNA polymerase specialized sigma24 family protein